MSALALYRGIPKYPAALAALLMSILTAGLTTAAGVHLLGLLFKDGELGAGAIIVLFAFLFAPFAIVLAFSLLVHLHHSTTWRAPTLAFLGTVLLFEVLYRGMFPIGEVGAGAGWLIAMCVIQPPRREPNGEA